MALAVGAAAPTKPALLVHQLRLWLVTCWVCALAPAWAGQSYAVAMSASPQAYLDAAEAWSGFQAGQFHRVNSEVEALGWAKVPLWMVVRAAEPWVTSGPMFLTVSPIPVSAVQAWVWDSTRRQWQDLGRSGVSVPIEADEARTQGISYLRWPANATLDTHVVVKLQPIGYGILRGRLVDNADHETLISARGAGLGLVWCFMIVSVAFGMQVFMLTRHSTVAAWTMLAIGHAWILGVYEGLWPLCLPGVAAESLNRWYGAVIALITLAYSSLLLKDFVPPSPSPLWHRWLGVSALAVLLAAAVGEWHGDSSLQGVLIWQLLQSTLLLGLLLHRLRAYKRPWLVIAVPTSAALWVFTWSHGALLGLWPYRVLMHHGLQFTQWVMVLWVGYVLLNGTMTERRAARAERKRLNALLRQDNLRLEQRVEQRTAELREALADVQRLEGHQRELLSLASHEFRTPAAIISSSLDVIDSLPDGIAPCASPYMDSVRAASKRLVYLANKLIDHDRWREMAVKLHLEALELRTWTQAVVDDLPRDSRVVTVLSCEPIPLRADSVLLRIALQNLIDNALLHNRRDAPVTVRLERGAQQAHLMVDDGGQGVPDNQRRQVFSRYVSERGNAREAHGLGLFIVHNIARQHGGTVQASDAPGGGARFIISLPICTDTFASNI